MAFNFGKREGNEIQKNDMAAAVMNCPICFEEFRSEGSRRPKVLQCQHNLCLRCLRSHYKTSCNRVSNRIQPKKIECPICRVFTRLKSADSKNDTLLRKSELDNIVATNLTIIAIIEHRKTAAALNKESTFECRACSRYPRWYCIECDRKICDVCFEEHLEQMKNHEGVNIGEQFEAARSNHQTRNEFEQPIAIVTGQQAAAAGSNEARSLENIPILRPHVPPPKPPLPPKPKGIVFPRRSLMATDPDQTLQANHSPFPEYQNSVVGTGETVREDAISQHVETTNSRDLNRAQPTKEIRNMNNSPTPIGALERFSDYLTDSDMERFIRENITIAKPAVKSSQETDSTLKAEEDSRCHRTFPVSMSGSDSRKKIGDPISVAEDTDSHAGDEQLCSPAQDGKTACPLVLGVQEDGYNNERKASLITTAPPEETEGEYLEVIQMHEKLMAIGGLKISDVGSHGLPPSDLPENDTQGSLEITETRQQINGDITMKGNTATDEHECKSSLQTVIFHRNFPSQVSSEPVIPANPTILSNSAKPQDKSPQLGMREADTTSERNTTIECTSSNVGSSRSLKNGYTPSASISGHEKKVADTPTTMSPKQVRKEDADGTPRTRAPPPPPPNRPLPALPTVELWSCRYSSMDTDPSSASPSGDPEERSRYETLADFLPQTLVTSRSHDSTSNATRQTEIKLRLSNVSQKFLKKKPTVTGSRFWV